MEEAYEFTDGLSDGAGLGARGLVSAALSKSMRPDRLADHMDIVDPTSEAESSLSVYSGGTSECG